MIRFLLIAVPILCLASCRQENEKWYTAKCELLCDEETGRQVDIEKLKRYRPWYPYDTIQNTESDTTTISFDFIAGCCLNFDGEAEIKHDTLKLSYTFANDTLSPCDCLCDYRMIYKIKNKHNDWSALKILNKTRSGAR